MVFLFDCRQTNSVGRGIVIEHLLAGKVILPLLCAVFQRPGNFQREVAYHSHVGRLMKTNTRYRQYTPFELAEKYPAINSDQLLGYVHRNLKELDEYGVISWRDRYSSVFFIDEKKFFKHVLYFKIKD